MSFFLVFLQYIKVLLKHDVQRLEIRTVTLSPYEGQNCKNIYSFLLCSRQKKIINFSRNVEAKTLVTTYLMCLFLLV